MSCHAAYWSLSPPGKRRDRSDYKLESGMISGGRSAKPSLKLGSFARQTS